MYKLEMRCTNAISIAIDAPEDNYDEFVVDLISPKGIKISSDYIQIRYGVDESGNMTTTYNTTATQSVFQTAINFLFNSFYATNDDIEFYSEMFVDPDTGEDKTLSTECDY